MARRFEEANAFLRETKRFRLDSQFLSWYHFSDYAVYRPIGLILTGD